MIRNGILLHIIAAPNLITQLCTLFMYKVGGFSNTVLKSVLIKRLAIKQNITSLLSSFEQSNHFLNSFFLN
jgi:hypothetical protein